MSANPPFEMPDFYFGWPARCNVHVEETRAHTKAWAREMGMLATPASDDTPEVWDEAYYDAMDLPGFAAWTHPDALPEQLDLASDWNVWGFYFDDLFVEVYKRGGDPEGGRAHIARLSQFMPLDLGETPPEPTNPVERGLRDLWWRTCPAKTPGWRARWLASTKALIDTVAWELTNIDRQRTPNPLEYFQTRRLVGGGRWTALIIELTHLVELPERIVESRPMCVLRDAFSDAALLRNDLFSYEREVGHEGELGNIVVILEHFFGIGAQAAADMTNELLSSRLYQFEHTAATEVPMLFAEQALTPVEQAVVTLYVTGLQDAQSGNHEWHVRSSRYSTPAEREGGFVFAGGPTGLGTDTARIFAPTPESTGLTRFRAFEHVPYRQVGPTPRPDLYMPFVSRLNAGYDAASEQLVEWCHAMGMLEAIPGAPRSTLWTEDDLVAFDLAQVAGRLYPDAPPLELEVAADWVAWGTYASDCYQRVFATSRNLAAAKLCNARLAQFMPLDVVSMPPPANPLERGLADLWPRTATGLELAERKALRRGIETLLAAFSVVLENHLQHRIADPVDYLEMRRITSGGDLLTSLLSPERARLPAALLESLPMLAVENAAQDFGGLLNDICSYQQEIEFEGGHDNGVLVVESFLGIEHDPAVIVVADLLDARVLEFEHVVATELPIVADALELDEDTRAILDRRVDALRDYIVGLHSWCGATRRYDEPQLKRRYAPRPQLVVA